MTLIITQQLKEKKWCQSEPTDVQKDLQATLVSQKCWKPQAPKPLQWGALKRRHRILHFSRCWVRNLPARQRALWELSGSRPLEMFCPHVLPWVTHWPHPQRSQGPGQNVYKFSSPCLPTSFVSLLPLKATLPFGTRIKGIKETRQEK